MTIKNKPASRTPPAAPQPDEPDSAWDALRDLVTALQETCAALSTVKVPAAVLLRFWQLAPAASVGAAIAEFLTGWGLPALSSGHASRAVVALAIAAPAEWKVTKALARESDRHRERRVRVESEDRPAFVDRKRREQRRHEALGRILSPSTDLAAVPGVQQLLDESVVDLRGSRHSVGLLLVRERSAVLNIVMTAGDVEPSLETGVTWPRNVIFGSELGYGAILSPLGLHHARVRFSTGTRNWDLICVTGAVLSDDATIQVAKTVSSLLETAVSRETATRQRAAP